MFKDKLVTALRIKTPCIWINTFEEAKALIEVREAVNRSYPNMIIESFSLGFRRVEEQKNAVPKMSPDTPSTIMKEYFRDAYESKEERMLIIKDAHKIFENAQECRSIRDYVERTKIKGEVYRPIIVISPLVKIPEEQDKVWTVLDLELPSDKDIRGMLNAGVRQIVNKQKENPALVVPSDSDIDECVSFARGLTVEQIKLYLRESIATHNTIKPELFYEARLKVIKKTGMLKYMTSNTNMDEIGGNENFKEWIQDIKCTMTKEAEEFGVERSKGYLALGVPGTAKTFLAQIVGNELGLPVLKFEMSSVMNSLVGQSERNMAEAVNMIKACAPCVLFIDEIEKTLSGN